MTLTRLRITVCVVALFAAASVPAAPFAYVPNEKSGTLSVIGTATDQLVGEIKAGAKPRGTAVSKDGKRMCVSDQPANSLDIIDTETDKAVKEVAVGEIPWGVVIR
jgi:YVTN family beta-propeller protein